jgi:hypothetical protein
MSYHLAELESAVDALYDYLETTMHEEKEVEREALMHLVHEVNQAYFNWAYSIDGARVEVVE